jgi:predicted transcriptional regulator
MVSAKQREILAAISQGNVRFSGIKNHFKKAGLTISSQGLSKDLRKLISSGYISESLNGGHKVYNLTEAGSGYLDKYYWPLLDEMTRFNRDEWPSKTFDFYTNVQEIIFQPNALNQRSFYSVPLSFEYNFWILAGLANSIINLNYMEQKPDVFSDLYIVLKIKLREVERIAEAFKRIWLPHAISEEQIFDIISNRIAKLPDYLKRSFVTSLGMMLTVAGMKKGNRKKMREISKGLGEVVFKRLNLISDLDQEVIDIFIESIDAGRDPLEESRLKDRLIRNVNTPYGKRQLFGNLLQDYLAAALFKKNDTEFQMKMNNYMHGTQGILLRMLKYERELGIHAEQKNPL